MKAYKIFLILLLTCPVSGAERLTEKDAAEYYRLGSMLLYKQLLAANERIAELEARLRTMELEKEATEALAKMADFRARVLGDARCTIDEQDLSIECPKGVNRATQEKAPER